MATFTSVADPLGHFGPFGGRFVPETLVAPIGYAVESRYVKGALERLGVEAQVFARGTYKSAAETLVREGMSEPQREQVGELLSARHEALVSALAERSGGDRDKARGWIDEAPHRAERARELGLVDVVSYEDGLDAVLGEGGKAPPYALADRYFASMRPHPFRPLLARPVVAVVEVHGPIVSRARFAVGPLATEERIVAAIRVARMSRRVGAVVLHIDSPGGSALASDRIHHEVERLAADKPVVAYLSNVAASGGYYVAAGARLIVAEPATVTGSIGVVSVHFVLRGLFEKLGVTTDVVKRGERADLFSPSRLLGVGERGVLEAEMEAFYRTFLGVVARGRRRPVEEIAPLAEGRVWSGAEARARGLVDELGSFADAVRRAAELGGVQSLEPVVVRPPRLPVPPPPLVPKAVWALCEALGLVGMGERIALGLNLGERERVLLYEVSALGDTSLPEVKSGSGGRTPGSRLT